MTQRVLLLFLDIKPIFCVGNCRIRRFARNYFEIVEPAPGIGKTDLYRCFPESTDIATTTRYVTNPLLEKFHAQKENGSYEIL